MAVKRRLPGVGELPPDPGGDMDGIAEGELSPEEHAELLDVKAWDPMLETYSRTMRLAVALTDTEGSLLGTCHNSQPVWNLLRSSTVGKETGCPFCLSPLSPCTGVVDALRTGLPTFVRDAAGLTHVAVPLLLGDHRLGAILAGQVSDDIQSRSLCSGPAKNIWNFGAGALELVEQATSCKAARPCDWLAICYLR